MSAATDAVMFVTAAGYAADRARHRELPPGPPPIPPPWTIALMVLGSAALVLYCGWWA